MKPVAEKYQHSEFPGSTFFKEGKRYFFVPSGNASNVWRTCWSCTNDSFVCEKCSSPKRDALHEKRMEWKK